MPNPIVLQLVLDDLATEGMKGFAGGVGMALNAATELAAELVKTGTAAEEFDAGLNTAAELLRTYGVSADMATEALEALRSRMAAAEAAMQPLDVSAASLVTTFDDLDATIASSMAEMSAMTAANAAAASTFTQTAEAAAADAATMADMTVAATDLAVAEDEVAASSEAASASMGSLNSALGALGIAAIGLTTVTGLASSLNDVGTAAYRAQAGLDVMTGGQGAKDMAVLRDATHGFVSDLDLGKAATMEVSSGLALSADEMGKITQQGTVLGLTFSGDALTGIQNYLRALESVGNVRSLAQLGIDVQTVKDEYAKFTKEGIDQTVAWRMAVEEAAGIVTDKLAPAIENGVGSQMDKLNTKIANLRTQLSEGFATTINVTLEAGTQGGMGGLFQLFGGLISAPATQGAGGQLEFDPSKYPLPASANGNINPPPGLSASQLSTWDAMMYGGPGMMMPDTSVTPSFGGDPTLKAAMALYPGFAPQTALLMYYQRGQAGFSGMGAVTPPTSQPTYSYFSEFGAGSGLGGSGLPPGFNVNDLNQGSPELTQAGSLAQRARLQESIQYLPQAQDAMKQLFSDIGTLGEKWTDMWKKAGDDAAEYAKRQQSVAAAFGISAPTGFTSETTGDVSSGVSAARQALQARDQATAAGRRQEAQDLANFDNQAKEAMDAYALATGQATQKSLEFRNEQDALKQRFIDGKMTASEFASAMLGIANDASKGTDSINDFNKAFLATFDPKQRGAIVHQQRAQQAIDKAEGGSDQAPTLGTDSADPFGLNKLATNAKTASDNVTAIGTAAGTAATDLQTGVAKMISSNGGLGSVTTESGKAAQKIQGLYKQIQDLSGTLVIQIGFNSNYSSDNETRTVQGPY